MRSGGKSKTYTHTYIFTTQNRGRRRVVLNSLLEKWKKGLDKDNVSGNYGSYRMDTGASNMRQESE